MKKANNIFLLLICILATSIIVSCDDMNDIQSQFADRDEIIYLGKVDSVKFYPGNGRVKITWYVSSDPKIDKTIIYWNMREDSIVKDFVRNTPGVQKDSIIIENIPEGSTLFEFRNISSTGESSLYSMAAGTSWGTDFADGLYYRRIVSRDFDYDDSEFSIGLSSVFNGDSVVYSEVSYVDLNGDDINIRIDRDTDDLLLEDFPDGGELKFRTAFFPPQGIDTIFNNYQVYYSPKGINEPGKLLSLKGHANSRYFEREGELYEWNANGDILVYTFDEEGELVLSAQYPEIHSRTVYREFFFHDDDKFISIGVDNRVYMLQFVDGELSIVKTPTGVDYMATGYSMPTFIPGKAFFFSIYANKDLKTFFPNNNSTWGEGNNTLVSTGFSYLPVTVFNNQYMVGVDATGGLHSYPITTIGKVGNKTTIGSGWNKFKTIVGLGDKLLALDGVSGDFFLFDFNATDFYWIID